MPKKRKRLFVEGTAMDGIVEELSGKGYAYLGASEFKRGRTIEQTMSKMPYKCFHIRNRKVGMITVEELDLWNPKDKVYCELRFIEGLSKVSTITIGKVQFTGDKALELMETRI